MSVRQRLRETLQSRRNGRVCWRCSLTPSCHASSTWQPLSGDGDPTSTKETQKSTNSRKERIPVRVADPLVIQGSKSSIIRKIEFASESHYAAQDSHTGRPALVENREEGANGVQIQPVRKHAPATNPELTLSSQDSQSKSDSITIRKHLSLPKENPARSKLGNDATFRGADRKKNAYMSSRPRLDGHALRGSHPLGSSKSYSTKILLDPNCRKMKFRSETWKKTFATAAVSLIESVFHNH